MTARYLLYVDILGFSGLVAEKSSMIDDLYEVIASLNVHKHPAFREIVFSDTILVYNTDSKAMPGDRGRIVMFLCEFAQDLQDRLISKGIFFRAVIVHGEFNHYELNSIPCFFGSALIDAYKSQKDIQAIGLFMHKSIVPDSSIFFTADFDENYHFVYFTQDLNSVEYDYNAEFPLPSALIVETEMIFSLVPEVLYLQQIHKISKSEVDDKIRQKYIRTWELFEKRYPKTLRRLVQNGFDLSSICPDVDWTKVTERYPEDYSWAVKSRVEY